MVNLCTICMRGGSKGVPNKNINKINGKPLLSYTIEQALDSNLFEHIVVSTDSEKIAKLAVKYGADAWFLRPQELASDRISKLPAIKHAFLESEKHYNKTFNILMDLDATSPLRIVDDIENAYNQFLKDKADILISASPCRKNPYFNQIELLNGKIKPVKETDSIIVRRQDAPKVYDMNASIYIWERNALLNCDTLFTDKTSLYVMPEERSVDIDTEIDFNFVEFMMSKNK